MKQYDPVGHKRQLADQAYCLIANATEHRTTLRNQAQPDQEALASLEADLKTMNDLVSTLGTQLTKEDVAAIEATLAAFDEQYGQL